MYPFSRIRDQPCKQGLLKLNADSIGVNYRSSLQIFAVGSIDNRIDLTFITRENDGNNSKCWCKHNNNGNYTKKKLNNTLNIIKLKIRTQHYLD